VPVLAAGVGLAAFIAVRAISLHDVDHWLRVDDADGLGERIELGLVVLVGVLTIRWLARERRIIADTLARHPVRPGRPPGSQRATVSHR